MSESVYASWNPWHGCTKISPGCKYCYVYRQDEKFGNGDASRQCRKNASFGLPVQRKRDGRYKIPPGKIIFTCFTSDFLLEDADPWREECWKMIKERRDCTFLFLTKRIERFMSCSPDDWGDGYDNVVVCCTVENQENADRKLSAFVSMPIKHRGITAQPLIGPVDMEKYLDNVSGKFTSPDAV